MNCKTSGQRSPSMPQIPRRILPKRLLRGSFTRTGLCLFGCSWLVWSWLAFFELPRLFAQPPVDLQPPVDFQKDVRPILANHCFACHGFDDKGRQADLRLDLEPAALEPGGTGRIIVAGNPDHSELIRRILSEDPDSLMPPASCNKPLSDLQKDVLRRWIAQGARYEKHWAFSSLRRPALPDLKNHPNAVLASLESNAIDRYVQTELDKLSLSRSPRAQTATLVRRLYLDLVGTLPSPEELQAVCDDRSLNPIDRLIENLLASPQFGERWGRFWLDQARYADSNGFTIDGARVMWPYRDWVIAAVNADMPFDQFTIEQLAGDQLDPSGSTAASKRQRIASAFHRNTMINEEGGVKADQYRHEAIIDRVNTTGSVWLGLTLGCAQCHTHKYDPISIDDYYRLYAFFNACADNNGTAPTLEVLEGEVFGLPDSVFEDLSQLKILREKLAALETEKKKLQEAEPPELEWKQVSLLHAMGSDGPEFLPLEFLQDGSVRVPDKLRGNTVVQVDFIHPEATDDPKPITAIRLRTLPDDSLPKRGPGTASNGNFVLSEIELFSSLSRQVFSQAWADHSQSKFPVANAIDGDPKTGWAINTDAAQVKAKPDLKINAPHWAVFALAKPIDPSGTPIEILLMHDINQGYLIGRFALDISTSPIPKRTNVPTEVAVPTEDLEALQSQIAQYSSRLPNQGKHVAQMVSKDQPEPPTTYRLPRGDFLSPDKDNGPLLPSIPSVFRDGQATGFGQGQELPMLNRLDLARWIVSSQNPLTARVITNRVWMKLFGTGLVETENDFGLQGAMPSHPELLDWLSSDWVDSGWSLKHLIHRIVSSETYQQSSAWREDLAQVDPANRMLARQSRIRLDAEILRDRALSASGAISLRIGGPSVHPPQPAGVYNFTQTTKAWKEDTGANRYRKTMYTEFFRSAPYPLLTTFDSPDFSTVCTRRSRTNTPLQALTMANDPVFWELSELLAQRAKWESDPLVAEQRIHRMVLLAWCRDPSQQELQRLVEFHRANQEYYRQNPAEIESTQGALASDPVEAAYAQVARVLFNTDEFVNRE
ncbi:MAG: PSD1 and planctomycete cytochrome C domain-containing protein [Planctomycetota bacterium]|nr:PSD1 and planctomycete cytochrome C domain-containing protein [Planctomycetota bacterium]